MLRHFQFDDYPGIKKILQDKGFRHDQEMVEAVLSRCKPTAPCGGVYTAEEILDNATDAETHLSDKELAFGAASSEQSLEARCASLEQSLRIVKLRYGLVKNANLQECVASFVKLMYQLLDNGVVKFNFDGVPSEQCDPVFGCDSFEVLEGPQFRQHCVTVASTNSAFENTSKYGYQPQAPTKCVYEIVRALGFKPRLRLQNTHGVPPDDPIWFQKWCFADDPCFQDTMKRIAKSKEVGERAAKRQRS